MSDERPRRSRRVAPQRQDQDGAKPAGSAPGGAAPDSPALSRVPAPAPPPADGAVEIRRVGSDGRPLGATAPAPAPTPAPKPAPRVARTRPPRPVAAPQKTSAPQATPQQSPTPRPTPQKIVTAPVTERQRPAAAVRTVESDADLEIDFDIDTDTSAAPTDTTPVQPTTVTPLGTVTGDAPLETKPSTGQRRSAKHELVEDARRQRRRARVRTTKRFPGRGVFGGLLVGTGIAAMLVLYGFLPFGEVTLAVPVVVCVVAGFLFGTRGPVRGRRPATAMMHVPDSPTLTGITPITALTTTATADPDAHRMSGSEDLGTVFGPTGHDDDDL